MTENQTDHGPPQHRDAGELADRLGRQAEAVCRTYLSNGRRQGGYWLAGDARNAPGRSLFVRLRNGPAGPAGKWTDAATGEHGDLLDLIGASLGLTRFADIAAEARRFLALPEPATSTQVYRSSDVRSPSAGIEPARRMFVSAGPAEDTLVERYLGSRGLLLPHPPHPLRFHPHCLWREDDGTLHGGPAMIAAVTDCDGRISGVHRTWLDPATSGKADIATPRRALGHLLGNGVRFGIVSDALLAGEGIETVLSVQNIAATLPAIATLSAAHLAALILPRALQRLTIAVDRDEAGYRAADRLAVRARTAGIEVRMLLPRYSDFNDDLRLMGASRLRSTIAEKLAPQDR